MMVGWPFCWYAGNSRRESACRLQKAAGTADRVEGAEKRTAKRKKEIKEKSEYMKTDQYIEDTAREKFGLVYGNEIIFKAADGESGN